MVLYSMILFLVGAVMAGMSIAIYKGKTQLIHDYHQTKVTDHAAYGKAFGKAMFVLSAALLVSGIVGLLGDSKTIVMLAVAVLFLGLIAGIVCIAAVQKKYNNGLF